MTVKTRKARAPRLRRFIKLVRSLQKSAFFVQTESVGVRNIGQKSGKIRLVTFGFDENLFRAYLVDFRKLILEGEETNFYSICNLVEKDDYPSDLKENVRKIRKNFSNVLNKDATLYDHKTHDKPRDVLDKWLNGKYFHNNPSKRKSIEGMGFVRHVHKIVFVATTLDLTRVSIQLADTLEKHLSAKASNQF